AHSKCSRALGCGRGTLRGPLGRWGGGLTSRWATVKMTGSMRKTRLDSLLIDAAMTCEFTTREVPLVPAPDSPPSFTVAFSVDRKRPRLL
uniref:Uncharacterized protein n=1 Tax=Ornithorhynchus anatinus TaxID=9258 RepID=A0A6I8NXV3_ORNAN